jgi:hypothetical protein
VRSPPLQHMLAGRPVCEVQCARRSSLPPLPSFRTPPFAMLLYPTLTSRINLPPPFWLPDGIYHNITLRNVTINNSAGRYGANLLMSSTNPATGIVFDSVGP